MEGRLLIVNADDFGLTAGVCRGVLRAHERGVVRSTSALVIAPAFTDHAAALASSGLAAGAHFAAVGEDPPVLSAREIPTLVDDRGRFPLRWSEFVRRSARGAVDTDDLRREFAAQLEVLTGHGIRPSHLDSHQNLHLWPQVANVVLELATAHGVRAVRVPRTLRWGPVSLGVRTLSSALRRRLTAVGVAFTAASVGLDEAGSMGSSELASALSAFAASSAPTMEVVMHLGEDPDPERSRYVTDYRWAAELEAACDPSLAATIDGLGVRLGSFADLSAAARG